MQLMTWTIARLGSRFNLLFEPYRRRVLHSALGRFLDQPLDLMVGIVEPDGTRRVLPFTDDPHGVDLVGAEQFERFNSITYRGHSEKYNLRFEFNVHSVFYPRDERLCLMPAFYLEARVSPIEQLRHEIPLGDTPGEVELFIRLRRPDTRITASLGGEGERARIDLAYSNTLTPRTGEARNAGGNSGGNAAANVSEGPDNRRFVEVRERIISLNPNCTALDDGDGLSCVLPVTEAGSGIKWRLVWAAHVDEPVLTVEHEHEARPARLHYRSHWANLDQVIDEAITTRDDRLAYSRRLEKILEQAPTDMAERHLQCQSFQSWLSNSFWCDVELPDGSTSPWFSVWEGTALYHSSLDEQYNASVFYLTLWPSLLEMQLGQWAQRERPHKDSEGAVLTHDLGRGLTATASTYPYAAATEQNSNFLLLLQAYAHWTGDSEQARIHSDLIHRLAAYLVWSDRDGSGFPSEGVGRTLDEGSDAATFARKHTYLAVKRAAALRAAADLLTVAGCEDGEHYQDACDQAIERIEAQAWLMDHYAMSADRMAGGGGGRMDSWSGKPQAGEETILGWDAYTIHTGNGLVLPMIIGQPSLLDESRLKRDLAGAIRENFTRYGCGHTSTDIERISISQNLWRDHLANYLRVPTVSSQCYWDMQVMSNTGGQSFGYSDTYINRYLCFYPRGVTSMGKMLAGPRLIVDRLAAAGAYVTVDPDRHAAQRWPLLALADWKAGKIPVCVVDQEGKVTIEGQIDPVIVHGEAAEPGDEDQPRGGRLIG